MKTILKRLGQLADDDLLALSEAIDVEVEHRLNRAETVPESARSRAIARGQSYRHTIGSAAPPIRAIGLRDTRRPRAA